ncbi:hypothetical protein [Tsukamurella tyrosinosolvens]|uniref:hypothetical protein n=1 Tax=Tsukamurella tyrosinosolvens TaxID=57704 RepID=UPI0011466419|nr:hypothetical protein [Tsukamurella tyrosinosolvens]
MKITEYSMLDMPDALPMALGAYPGSWQDTPELNATTDEYLWVIFGDEQPLKSEDSRERAIALKDALRRSSAGAALGKLGVTAAESSTDYKEQ